MAPLGLLAGTTPAPVPPRDPPPMAVIPGSKSHAQRAILAAACATGTTSIRGATACQDVSAALECARGLSSSTGQITGDQVSIQGCGAGGWDGLSRATAFPAGESATTARITCALLGLSTCRPRGGRVLASGTLLGRRSSSLFDCLARAGAVVEHGGTPGGWPVSILPLPGLANSVHLSLEAPSSSQEVSALLMGLAAMPAGVERRLDVSGPIPSAPYVDVTLGVLSCFGVEVERGDGTPATSFIVRGSLKAPPDPMRIPPDASSMALNLAASILANCPVRVPIPPGPGDHPDRAALELFQRMGCTLITGDGTVQASGLPSVGGVLDLGGCPDLAPVFAAMAASAAGTHGACTRLNGLHTLAGKESDRQRGIADALVAIGLEVTRGADSLDIAPGRGVPGVPDSPLDPRRDHRMAFMHALLGLVRPGVTTLDPGCVDKSWPGFWAEMEAQGIGLSRRLGEHDIRV